MSDFIVDKLTKSVGDKTVFRDISFIIHDLDRVQSYHHGIALQHGIWFR